MLPEAGLVGARAGGTQVVFDPNLRLRLWADAATMRREIEAAAGIADLALPNFDAGYLPAVPPVPMRKNDISCAEAAEPSEAAMVMAARNVLSFICISLLYGTRLAQGHRGRQPQRAMKLRCRGAGLAAATHILRYRHQRMPVGPRTRGPS